MDLQQECLEKEISKVVVKFVNDIDKETNPFYLMSRIGASRQNSLKLMLEKMGKKDKIS